jgi:hypothetical protein
MMGTSRGHRLVVYPAKTIMEKRLEAGWDEQAAINIPNGRHVFCTKCLGVSGIDMKSHCYLEEV